ncbi:MAG: DNA damage-inducible protein D [Candidatus Moranbacteria bacterium RIFOXYA12_FULL_35_19]|nr:MAG: DNA damage-inducible protein D [Candidatus Moranbacteria bacterium RIFOXYC12_FULL_36_13]OGI35921.1 MAG: DNA damage-inducible protein D [Candidatus Moranbacteria bacterium RIFOXYA12_FULL_35_19]
MKHEIIEKLHKNFNDYVQKTEDDLEFWFARDLQVLLGYDQWKNFQKVIEKAKIACENTSLSVSDHFADVGKMVGVGSGAKREIDDIALTRHACYLIAQNGDPRKEEIAFAMAYFAVQTRKQELIEKRIAEIERLTFREKLTNSEKELSGIIYERGVDNIGFARIRSQGDQALFGGNTTQDMKKKLGVKDSRALADFLPAITIKAKDFANEITNFTLKRDTHIHGEQLITSEHVKNNRSVRNLLVEKEIYPEILPAEEDVKKVERRIKSENKKMLKGTDKNKKRLK